MRNRDTRALLALATSSLLVQACATVPEQPVNSAGAATPSTEALTAKLDPVVAEAALGYERHVRNGELIFCKKERPIGSKLFSTICFTEAELRANVENTRKLRDEVLQEGRR